LEGGHQEQLSCAEADRRDYRVLRHAEPVAGLFHAAKGCSFLSEYGCKPGGLGGATVIAFPISSTHTINFRP
jgi:hypothetical protein